MGSDTRRWAGMLPRRLNTIHPDSSPRRQTSPQHEMTQTLCGASWLLLVAWCVTRQSGERSTMPTSTASLSTLARKGKVRQAQQPSTHTRKNMHGLLKRCRRSCPLRCMHHSSTMDSRCGTLPQANGWLLPCTTAGIRRRPLAGWPPRCGGDHRRVWSITHGPKEVSVRSRLPPRLEAGPVCPLANEPRAFVACTPMECAATKEHGPKEGTNARCI